MKLSVCLKNETKPKNVKYESSVLEKAIPRKSNFGSKSRAVEQRVLSTFSNDSKLCENSKLIRKSIQSSNQNCHETRKDSETVSFKHKHTETEISYNKTKTGLINEKVLDKSKSEANLIKRKAKKIISDKMSEFKTNKIENRNNLEFRSVKLKTEQDRSESYSFQPEINYSRIGKRSFIQFYSSQMDTLERKQQKVNDIKKTMDDKNKICETFTPSICKKSESLFKKITIGVSLNASDRLHLKKKNSSNKFEISNDESTWMFKKIYNSSPMQRTLSFPFAPTLFKSKYSG